MVLEHQFLELYLAFILSYFKMLWHFKFFVKLSCTSFDENSLAGAVFHQAVPPDVDFLFVFSSYVSTHFLVSWKSKIVNIYKQWKSFPNLSFPKHLPLFPYFAAPQSYPCLEEVISSWANKRGGKERCSFLFPKYHAIVSLPIQGFLPIQSFEDDFVLTASQAPNEEVKSALIN